MADSPVAILFRLHSFSPIVSVFSPITRWSSVVTVMEACTVMRSMPPTTLAPAGQASTVPQAWTGPTPTTLRPTPHTLPRVRCWVDTQVSTNLDIVKLTTSCLYLNTK